MRTATERGKTIVFATHYLEEADAFAYRHVLMARGRIIADGPPTEIRARAGSHTIRATLPGVDVASLGALPGVVAAERHGDAVILSCSDADMAVSALLTRYPAVRDPDIAPAGPAEAEWAANQRSWAQGWRRLISNAVPLVYLFFVAHAVTEYSR